MPGAVHPHLKKATGNRIVLDGFELVLNRPFVNSDLGEPKLSTVSDAPKLPFKESDGKSHSFERFSAVFELVLNRHSSILTWEPKLSIVSGCRRKKNSG
jgi:hypothetical protein